MKDALVVFTTIRRCRDAQYRIDKVFSRILELCEKERRRNENEVSRENESSNICQGFDLKAGTGANNRKSA
ncbi:MAG: hypothetical protein ACXVHR_09685 [Methanobacterium sp.]